MHEGSKMYIRTLFEDKFGSLVNLEIMGEKNGNSWIDAIPCIKLRLLIRPYWCVYRNLCILCVLPISASAGLKPTPPQISTVSTSVKGTEMSKLQTAKLSAASVVLCVLGAAGIVTAQNAREAPVRINTAVQHGKVDKPIVAVPRRSEEHTSELQSLRHL